MNEPTLLRSARLTALLVAGILAGCGGDSPDSLIASGKSFLAKNDSKAAVIQFKNALQQNPNLGEARFLLGKALLDGGDARSAEIELRKAFDLKYSPELTIPLLAKAMLADGQAKKVVDEFSSTEFSGEAAAILKTSLSQAYRVTGNQEAAQAALAAALAAKPDYAPALMAEARSKAVQNDVAGALSIVDGILGKSPDDRRGPDAQGLPAGAQGRSGRSHGTVRQGRSEQARLPPGSHGDYLRPYAKGRA